MREKEKKIGTTYFNLADYVSPDPVGVNEEVKLSIKVAESRCVHVCMLRTGSVSEEHGLRVAACVRLNHAFGLVGRGAFS